ncbi:heparinase II/III domain-containing protein [Hymenobacter ginkgonis]|uniref:heparinase II/III domain-containing protein n=1 Tax=Hymenobacter ginkgonis TaxID=2682976 RepID=UPI0018DD40E2|nr:heparinase II/III family protein [Hymenobacter ginkgonis]
MGNGGQLRAQSGSWNPPGADLAYPRTLLKGQALEEVRASLAAPDRLALYQGLWAEAQGVPPADNTSASGRRARATFAKNAAFVVLLGRQPDGAGGLAPLPADQRQALVAKVSSLLENSNTTVEGLTQYTEWQWRSKELIDYLIAYDLLRGASEPAAALAASQARLQAFAGNLYLQSTKPLFTITFYNTVKNNHALMTAAALGMAAVVLNEATSTDRNQQPANWAGVGLYTIDNVLWRDAQRQSDSTQVAGYAEGPYYFKYAMLNCLPFFRAMGNFLPDNALPYTFGATTRRLRNPYFDPKYTRLYDWVTAILQPDGRLPALADSYVDMGMPELALTGRRDYVKPMYFSKLSGTSMASLAAQLRDATVDMRAAWLAAALAPTAPNQPALTVLPAAGSLVFRSGQDSLANYLHLYGRGGLAQANAGGHSQGDASSFILHAQGQLLALDAGYLSYDRRAEVGQATNHNLVLVDGAGPAIGTAGAASSAVAAIEHTFQTPQLAYGEVTTAYQKASITRKILFVRGTYYLLADAVSAAAAHTYTWQLHGYGLEGGTAATGTFTNDQASQEATWQKNGVGLLAHVAAPGGATYTAATNKHEITYNTTENHTTLLVQTAAAAQAQFLAVLYPYTSTRPQVATTTSQPATAALATTGADFIDVAFAQADSVLQTDASDRLPQAVAADGLLNFYSATADGTFAQLFLQEGTVLRVGSTPVVQASRRATISWQRVQATSYAGYASRATTLTLALASAPAAITGPGVASYTYEASTHQLHLVLQAASDFGVMVSPTPLPVVLTAFAGQRQGEGVLLRWRTASEHESQGFEVQRQLAGGNPVAFEVIGFVGGRGNASQPTDYTFRDDRAPGAAVYYRLRQLDQSGAATYSPVVSLGGSAASQAALLPVLPQPAHAVLQVQLTGPAQDVTLRLLDGLGRVVRQQRCRQQTQLEVGALAPGLYYLVADDAAGQRLAGSQKVLLD